MMNHENIQTTRADPTASPLFALLGFLRTRLGIVTTAALAIGGGFYFGWGYVVAAGLGPLTPSVALCALGLCMGGGHKRQDVADPAIHANDDACCGPVQSVLTKRRMAQMTNVLISRRKILPLFVVALAIPASAHTLEALEQDIIQSEKYFQPEDKEAPSFTLQDVDGKPVSLSDFRGKVVVLHFIYTNCPDFCPLQTEKLAEVQKMVNITPMINLVQFISITTDPSRDTGQVLKDFGAAHGLDPVNWIFLTATQNAPEDSTRKLSASYGVEFKPAAEGVQMHGVATMVIDQNGRLVGRFHSLKFENLSLVKFINALTNHHHREGPSRGFWARMWEWL